MLQLRRFGLLSVIGCIPLMPLLVLPAMVGTLIDETSLTEAQAGWSASLNFLGGAIIAGLMALRMHRLDLSKVAAIGFLVAAIGDGLSGFSAGHAPLFLFVRFCTGVGAGAAYTSVLAAFARLPDVNRGYALFITLQFTISGLGEVGMAFVVPKPGAELSPEAIIAWCRDNMANYKVPRRVALVDALPVNATGKVTKFVLREQAASRP